MADHWFFGYAIHLLALGIGLGWAVDFLFPDLPGTAKFRAVAGLWIAAVALASITAWQVRNL